MEISNLMKPQNSSQKFRILGPENPKFKEDFLGIKNFQRFKISEEKN